MKVRAAIHIDPAALEEAILEAASSIGQVDGVGADGDSEYEVVSVELVGDGITAVPEVVVEFELEHTTGKFASRDEIASEIMDQIDGELIEAALELTPE